MIIGGRKTLQNVPVICVGHREHVSVILTGTTWKTVWEYTGFENLVEILANVPSLAGATGVYFGLFDPSSSVDGTERWKSGLVGENTYTDVGLDRIITPGNLLRVKANAGTGTEVLGVTIYGAGI
jgi:hypothetical protein